MQRAARGNPERQLERGWASPLGDRICEFVCFGAAFWTLCCHAVVARGGSLHDLLWTVAAVGSIGVAMLLGRRRLRSAFGSETRPPAATSSPAPDPQSRSPRQSVGRGVWLGIGILALVVYAAGASVTFLWWASIAVLLLGLATVLATDPQPPAEEPARWSPLIEASLFGLGALAVLVPVFFHHIDLDTPFYVSLAVAAADAPNQPLMVDTIHGIDGLPLPFAAYRVHSFEVFNGALSYLTGIPAIYCYRWVTAAFAAFLTPIALACLFRILVPRYWLWAVVATLVVLVFGGGTNYWYGNFSLVRIFHGKSVYLSVFLPLAYAYGLNFGMKPTPRRWLLVGAAQIASVGCTSSAIWSVPIASSLAVACAVRLDRRAWRTLALAALTSTYVVVLGLWVRGDMTSLAAHIVHAASPGVRLADTLAMTFGTGRLAYFALGCLLVAWTVQSRGLAQRFSIIVPSVALCVIVNPYLEAEIGRNIVGPTYWRSMWSLPLPILIALTLTAPLRCESRRAAPQVACALALMIFAVAISPTSTLSAASRTRASVPGPAVFGPFYAIAKRLSDRVPSGSFVIAPQRIAQYVPAFHDHPFVPAARTPHLARIRIEYGQEEVDFRLHLCEAVSDFATDLSATIIGTDAFARRRKHADVVGLFRRGLRKYDVAAVIVNDRAEHATAIRAVLSSDGFTHVESLAHYQTWIRRRSSPAQPTRIDR